MIQLTQWQETKNVKDNVLLILQIVKWLFSQPTSGGIQFYIIYKSRVANTSLHHWDSHSNYCSLISEWYNNLTGHWLAARKGQSLFLLALRCTFFTIHVWSSSIIAWGCVSALRMGIGRIRKPYKHSPVFSSQGMPTIIHHFASVLQYDSSVCEQAQLSMAYILQFHL